MAQGRERFAQGFWIVIYPEGTRIRAGTRAKYKTGGARLAIAMDVPVIPVAHNAGYVWPKGLFGKRPGTITMTIGRADLAGGQGRRPRSRRKSKRGSRAKSRASACPHDAASIPRVPRIASRRSRRAATLRARPRRPAAHASRWPARPSTIA